MKKEIISFEDCFDDTAELKVETDDEGLLSAKGVVLLGNTHIKIKIHRRTEDTPASAGSNETAAITDSPESAKTIKAARRPLYSGTISLLSPEDGNVLLSEARRRKKENKENKGKEKLSNKDIYASLTYRCNTSDLKEIKSVLRRQVDKLLLENEEYLTEIRLKYMAPDRLTPLIAVTKYADRFLSITYSGTPERNLQRKKAIQKIFTQLPNIPMCKIRTRDINSVMDQHPITPDNARLCGVFWEYLLQHQKCSGKNPFPQELRRERTIAQQDKLAFSPSSLSYAVFEKMYRLINKRLSSLYCAVTLLLSGFAMTDITDLTWGDVEFLKGYDDFAIIHIRKDLTVVAKHDYSRPAIPDTVKYLRRVYDDLCNEHGEEDVNGLFIVTAEQALHKKADRADIVQTANNLLVRAGYTDPLLKTGRPSKRDEPIPVRLLQTNYQRMLNSFCGLSDDPDTASFLSGLQFQSSTYTNYESHTSPEAQYRLYTILQPLSVEHKLRKPKELRNTKDGQIYTAGPGTNHEVAQVFGRIQLPPGESITIRCPHGVTGSIKFQKEKGGEK